MQQTILNLNLDWLLLKSGCSSRWSSSTEFVEIAFDLLLDGLDLLDILHI